MEKQSEQSPTMVMTEEELEKRLKEERIKAIDDTLCIALAPILRFSKTLSEYDSENHDIAPIIPREIGDMLRLMALGGATEAWLQSNPKVGYNSFVILSDLKICSDI